VFSFVFGRLAQMPSDGIPYPLFSFVGLLPWTFFSNGLSKASTSLVLNSSLIKKIYFPRLILPISAIASGIIDFCLSFLMLIVLMLYYVVSAPADGGGSVYFQVTANIVWLPLLLLLTFISALGVSLWFAALNVSFRDVGQAINFITRIGLYLTPVAYPTSALPDALKVVSALNPMTGVVEGFRWALLGTNTAPQPTILVSALISVILLVTGAYYFRRAESSFADLV
jgi:lipopolysaccharide transport system permease protein